MNFDAFDLEPALAEALGYMGFENATPIQENAIPLILEGYDLIACAQTGTGKTAAFLLPILHKLASQPSEETRALIICPTRELAIQIEKQIEGFAYFIGVSSLAVYGGSSGSDFVQEKKALTMGSNIIVATPGKLISHLNLGYVNFDHIQHLILDEADRMLDMGFLEDIQKIISFLPDKRQNLMFSATMDPKIRKMAEQILHRPKSINIALAKPAEGVLQAAYMAYDTQKDELIHALLADKPEYQKILIFSSTRKKVSTILRGLKKLKFNTASISSDLEQSEREKVLLKFRQNKIRILVATDVLSRGVDIKDINLVINYDVPSDAADYVHRVGRTARASTTGVAITLINPADIYKFSKIEKLIESEVPKLALPEHLGKGPAYRLVHKKKKPSRWKRKKKKKSDN